jgi:hypothetical protein
MHEAGAAHAATHGINMRTPRSTQQANTPTDMPAA